MAYASDDPVLSRVLRSAFFKTKDVHAAKKPEALEILKQARRRSSIVIAADVNVDVTSLSEDEEGGDGDAPKQGKGFERASNFFKTFFNKSGTTEAPRTVTPDSVSQPEASSTAQSPDTKRAKSFLLRPSAESKPSPPSSSTFMLIRPTNTSKSQLCRNNSTSLSGSLGPYSPTDDYDANEGASVVSGYRPVPPPVMMPSAAHRATSSAQVGSPGSAGYSPSPPSSSPSHIAGARSRRGSMIDVSRVSYGELPAGRVSGNIVAIESTGSPGVLSPTTAAGAGPIGATFSMLSRRSSMSSKSVVLRDDADQDVFFDDVGDLEELLATEQQQHLVPAAGISSGDAVEGILLTARSHRSNQSSQSHASGTSTLSRSKSVPRKNSRALIAAAAAAAAPGAGAAAAGSRPTSQASLLPAIQQQPQDGAGPWPVMTWDKKSRRKSTGSVPAGINGAMLAAAAGGAAAAAGSGSADSQGRGASASGSVAEGPVSVPPSRSSKGGDGGDGVPPQHMPHPPAIRRLSVRVGLDQHIASPTSSSSRFAPTPPDTPSGSPSATSYMSRRSSTTLRTLSHAPSPLASPVVSSVRLNIVPGPPLVMDPSGPASPPSAADPIMLLTVLDIDGGDGPAPAAGPAAWLGGPAASRPISSASLSNFSVSSHAGGRASTPSSSTSLAPGAGGSPLRLGSSAAAGSSLQRAGSVQLLAQPRSSIPYLPALSGGVGGSGGGASPSPSNLSFGSGGLGFSNPNGLGVTIPTTPTTPGAALTSAGSASSGPLTPSSTTANATHPSTPMSILYGLGATTDDGPAGSAAPLGGRTVSRASSRETVAFASAFSSTNGSVSNGNNVASAASNACSGSSTVYGGGGPGSSCGDLSSEWGLQAFGSLNGGAAAGEAGEGRAEAHIRKLWAMQERTEADLAAKRVAMQSNAVAIREKEIGAALGAGKWHGGMQSFRHKTLNRDPAAAATTVTAMAEYDQPRFRANKKGDTKLVSYRL